MPVYGRFDHQGSRRQIAHITVIPEDEAEPDLRELYDRYRASEEAILHITLVVGYFNFVNRIANGLGFGLEDYRGPDPSLPMAHHDRPER